MNAPDEGRPRNAVVGWLASARDFVVAARAEMTKVTWPSRTELMEASRMIIILSVVLGVSIGLVDVLLNQILVRGVAALAR